MGVAVSPGDSNQKIMFRFGIALLVLISVVTAKDVFRYDDEETGQSHYMTGDPGASVEGGWAFTNSDGTFELVYKADEGGFQPEADHIPVAVADTNDVTAAKTSFYTLFEEHKAKVEAAIAEDATSVVDARRKRSPQDVFRYEDAETGQSHYMTGEPGKAVEGGFTFTNPEGSYELVYKADEMGFQPEAAHIPIPVEDTDEVVDAKTKFYSLYDEHKAKVEAAAVVDARRKREAHHPHGDTDTVEKSQDLIMPPHPYNFHPFLGLGAVKPEDSANKLYKYIPYYGFVPAEEEDEEENVGEVEVEDEKERVLYKYDPLYGFVKADQEIKPLEEQEYKYTPYVGFVPVTGEEEEDVKTYKFNPFYGFVEKNDEDREKTAEEMKDQQYKFVPYYGFLPTPTDGEVETQLYKLDPVVGFYPSEKTEEVEVEEVGAKLEAKRKKRDAQFLYVPHFPLTAQYLPVIYPHFSPITTQVQYTPGRVAAEEETGESTEETKPAVAPLVPASTSLLYPVTYPVGHPATFPVTQVVYPVQGQATLPEEEFPVIPHDEEDTKPGPVEKNAKNHGNLKYTFHPYYGFLPTPTDGEVGTQLLYKLDPVLG